MILRLRLRNWRAFDDLDLELGPGTTFIVASNGIGKTSLMMAATWVLFGEASGVAPTEEKRGDADSTRVDLALALPATGVVSIGRWTDRRGRSRLEARIGDRVITAQEELEALLAEELGADPHVLARLTFMTHGGSLQSEQGEFHLRDHLARVFGAAPLLQAATSAERLVSEAGSAMRRLKAARRTDAGERDTLLAEIASIDEQLASTRSRREDAVSRLNELDERRRLAEAWSSYRSAIATREEKLAKLLRSARDLVPEEHAGNDVLAALDAAERDLQESLSSRERDLADTRARLVLTEEATDHLRRAEAICPTCLRPLSEHERTSALTQHDHQLSLLRSDIAIAERGLETRQSALLSLRTVITGIRSVPEPARPTHKEIRPADEDAIRDLYERARDEVIEVDRLIAEYSAERGNAVTSLEALQDEERQMEQMHSLIRVEALGRAAAEAFGSTADAITNARIEPLVEEVGRRWKLIFGTEGLRLSANGEITREVGNRVLPFRSLSGGEKIWALLLTRLLITSASTRAPFIWLDEPLEHLDPRLRKVVAGTLARASLGGTLRQVVVTTYEADVARQLMEDVPSSSLIYVRAAD
ncbi:MAG: AAA family ATPase [Actinomycetota bacterium]|nr:AAA family ATPase [Actinomycetota bacterium]